MKNHFFLIIILLITTRIFYSCSNFPKLELEFNNEIQCVKIKSDLFIIDSLIIINRKNYAFEALKIIRKEGLLGSNTICFKSDNNLNYSYILNETIEYSDLKKMLVVVEVYASSEKKELAFFSFEPYNQKEGVKIYLNEKW
jgi:hypothetical protein